MITVHVTTDNLNGIVHDLEIFFGDQQPPWQGGQPVQGPPGWVPMNVPGGIGWMTNSNPLLTCRPVTFVVAVPPGVPVGDFITIHLTDKSHNNLGNITSQRVPPPGSRMPDRWMDVVGILLGLSVPLAEVDGVRRLSARTCAVTLVGELRRSSAVS